MNNSHFSSAKIIVVDDRPLSRMTAVDLLSLDGYQVVEAGGDSQEQTIFDFIVQEKPDLVLLDIKLSKVNGFDVCAQLKQDPRTELLPVVLTAIEARREYRIKVAQIGADALLVKPLDRFELSGVVKNLLNQKRLNEGLDQTEHGLFTIAKAVESRSSDREGSCARIAELIKIFGEYLSIGAKDIDNLVFVAHLHDIGTIAIPDAVMLKTEALTPEEKEMISQHVLIGEKICRPLRNRRGVLPIIRHHHERWDGTGYPDGLSGEEIPYLAQVFQIIDIYDALTSDRPHQQAYTPEQALQIIDEETEKGWRNPLIFEQFSSFIKTRTNLVVG